MIAKTRVSVVKQQWGIVCAGRPARGRSGKRTQAHVGNHEKFANQDRRVGVKDMFSTFLAGLVLFSAATAMSADKLVLVAGGGTNDTSGIPATEARLKEPFGVDFDSAGNLFIIEMARGNRLLRVDARGALTHVAGAGASGNDGDDGPPLKAEFNSPHNLAVLPDGDVLIADTWNGRIRRVDWKTDKIKPVAGFSVPAAEARRAGPYCITLDFSGSKLYVADLRRIHVIDLKTGQSKIIAGNGQKGTPADGTLATEVPLFDPRAVAPDRKGNVYVLERGGHALRVVDPNGKIRTVVNAAGKRGGEGDGGDGLLATMDGPKHLCVDLDDNIIIADTENHLIRKYVHSTGRIIRVAGSGKKGVAGLNGAPENAELNRPHGVTVHKDGTLYIADSDNDRILRITR
jgi:sugar lactone lactonase YvrE